MANIFIEIFNNSFAACWIAAAVILLRPLLSRAPKWINCLLWGLVGLRLILPFSLESIFSLIPSAEPLPSNIALSPRPSVNVGIPQINAAVNPIISENLAPSTAESVNPMQVILGVGAWVWIVGMAVMALYGAVSCIVLRRKVSASLCGGNKVYFCDNIDSPFILGVFRPRMYLPSGIAEDVREHVLAHERAHLKRRDHIWKPLAFVILAVYWFNPLLWAAYILLCRDIESACDEKVIKSMDASGKKGYSEALLSCSMHRRMIMACPIAFGEVGVKARIKAVLNYKKPALWIIIAALVVTLVTTVCFLTDPAESGIRDIKASESGGGVVLKIKYRDLYSYSVRNVTKADGEYFGDGLGDYDGSLGEYRIMIRFGDAVLSESMKERFPAGESVVLYEKDGLLLKARVAYPSDSGFVMYIGSDTHIAVTNAENIKPKRRSGSFEVVLTLSEEAPEPRDLDELRRLYPQYFGLDTSEGLVMYVAKDISGALGCGILEGMNKNYSPSDFFSLRRVSVEEMKLILSTYDISDSQIAVAVSERVIHFWLTDVTADGVRELFGADFADYADGGRIDIYDIAVFDIDLDGDVEECVLSVGLTSGFSSYLLTVIDPESGESKFYNNYDDGCIYPYFTVRDDGEIWIAERVGNMITYSSGLKTGTSEDYGKYFSLSKTETEEIFSTDPVINASRFEITLKGREDKIYIRDSETVQWISLLVGAHIWGDPKEYTPSGELPLCKIEAFGESGQALNVYTVWDENTVSASDFEGYAYSECTGYILSYIEYLLSAMDINYQGCGVQYIEIWQFGRCSMIVKDADTVKEIISMLENVGGTPGESTRGYYGSYYGIKIYTAGEDVFSFSVWDEEKFSSSKYKDNYGYDCFLVGADLSKLYPYLLKLCPMTQDQ